VSISRPAQLVALGSESPSILEFELHDLLGLSSRSFVRATPLGVTPLDRARRQAHPQGGGRDAHRADDGLRRVPRSFAEVRLRDRRVGDDLRGIDVE
jgi:hypothetical protein